MASIKLLSESVINKIAAGEVVERPSSVAKELVENSIDAGATEISVAVLKGGRSLIRVRDDGCGMAPEDAKLALERHSTSKISDASDLFSVRTMGFRGEALPSIAAVSRLELTTKEKGSVAGTRIVTVAGRVEDVRECGAPDGTEVVVRDLFFNTPVRRKFLRTERAELSRIASTIIWYALARPAIGFTLTADGQELIKAPAVKSLRDRIASLFGLGTVDSLITVDLKDNKFKLNGFISKPTLTRGNRTGQHFFINGRPVSDRILNFAVFDAYAGLLTSGRHPVVFLFLELEPNEVDVNVHPTKREVQFRSAATVRDLFRGALMDALGKADLSREIQLTPVETVAREYKEPYLTKEQGGVIERIPVKELSQETLPWESDAGVLYEEGRSSELRALGQIKNLYVLCEGPEGLAIIDQHAAHERILFEKLLHFYKKGSKEVQNLLSPVVINLSAAEFIFACDCLGIFNALGIITEKFGKNAIKIDGLPACLGEVDPEPLLHDLIGELLEAGKGKAVDDELVERVAMKACRSAVKRSDALKGEELQRLVDDLMRCESPYNCPHGRPTIVRISTEELAKKFGRA